MSYYERGYYGYYEEDAIHNPAGDVKLLKQHIKFRSYLETSNTSQKNTS